MIDLTESQMQAFMATDQTSPVGAVPSIVIAISPRPGMPMTYGLRDSQPSSLRGL